MTRMDDKIGRYPELSPEERREVVEYVRQHPDLEPALVAIRRLDAALRAGRQFQEDPPTDEVLAFVVVMGDVDAKRMPPVLAEAVQRVRDRIGDDADARARYRRMIARRDALESQVGLPADLASLAGGGRGDALSGSPGRPASKRSNGRRRAVRVVLGLAAAYMLLFAAGLFSRPSHERLATFTPAELTLEGYERVRGEGAEAPSESTPDAPSDAVGAYLAALEQLKGAERSILGLFPRYDDDRLSRAATALRSVMQMEPEASFLFSEAAFLLGKTELARGNVSAARAELRRVASSGGRHAAEASRLVAAVEQLPPVGG